MSIITDILTGSASSIVDAVGRAADSMFTSDEERLKAELDLARLGLEREQAYLEDTQNARNMQVEALRQDDIFSKRFIYWFAIAWSAFSMIFFFCVTFMDIPEKNVRFVDTLLGFLLGTAIASIFNFFLGTSASSRAKDTTIQLQTLTRSDK